jgi:hypothetical protein
VPPARLEMPGHGKTHHAEPDKSDLGHRLSKEFEVDGKGSAKVICFMKVSLRVKTGIRLMTCHQAR